MSQSTFLQWLLYFVIAQVTPTLSDVSGSSITLSSSGNATIDIPIWFNATYMDYKEGDELEYVWYDDTWNSHKEPMLSGQSTWTLIYNKRTYRDYTGQRKVTVEVKKKWTFWVISRASIEFDLSEYLNGELSVSQVNVTTHTPGYISTGNQTNITALVDDPNDWMKKRTMFATFTWVISDNSPAARMGEPSPPWIIATCDTPSLLINITKPQDYQIEANVWLHLSGEIIKTTTHTPTTVTTPATTQMTITQPGSTTQSHITTSQITTERTSNPPHPKERIWQCSGWWPSYGARRNESNDSTGDYEPGVTQTSKYGRFTGTTKAREPIRTLNVTGEQWLTRNKLLNLSVSCSGSGSWTYCFSIFQGSYNVTGNETCQEPVVTTVCNFPLIRFFKRNGTFTYLIIVTNEVSTQIQAVPIKIYNVGRKPQLTYIIIPVSCSLVVIIIIIFGSAYLLQSRKRYLVEVADFDFVVSDDIIYNKTMCSQLREAFLEAVSAKTDDSEEEDNRWRERSRVVECPRFLEGSTQYGALHS